MRRPRRPFWRGRTQVAITAERHPHWPHRASAPIQVYGQRLEHVWAAAAACDGPGLVYLARGAARRAGILTEADLRDAEVIGVFY